MNEAYLLIGGNLGEREKYLSSAQNLIEQSCGTIVQQSEIYETAPWGLNNQGAFLNQALFLLTRLTPQQLLKQILEIEEMLGRKREIKYGPRIIDIDIILFGNEVVRTAGLSIPHPEMQNRRFVLTPLAEIAPRKMHPVLHKTILQLLQECGDTLTVQKFR